ncbi:Peptidase C48, SUMO/Sentrin/Ubl1 [Artemisia annua]|uniref:Peptidase C48, SUMO/Sentrin/Ubl1 n=1 Tax=Artemisia annua TaxID=35608 RepID=A0A2U1PXY1_ARTAN|nr:Peptidase C48, SUMO/Sentrin/Ubl1 [Artemisia annua]
MGTIEDEQGIGDLAPLLIVRRSRRLSDQMWNDAGGAGVPIDLTSDPENVDVPGSGVNGGNKRSQPRNIRLKKRPGGSLEGDVFVPSVVGKMEKVDEGGEVKKGHRKGSKFFIVSKVQGGDDGLAKKAVGKRKLCLNKKSRKKGLVVEEKEHEEDVDNDVGVRKRTRKSKMDGEAVANNKGENGVGCKVPDVDRIHQRISLWSLHRLLPKLSTKQKQDVTEMGFGAVLGFRIKDVPTRLSYWLLDNFDEDRCVLAIDGKEISITRETVRDVLGIPMGNVPVEAVDEADFRHPLVVEWKQQFDGTTRYKHIPVEKQIYTQQEGGWMFKLNFLVLYFTSIGEANKNATVNLRFFNRIQDENDIPGFDWCSYVIECLVRTKRSWVRTYHYCGPVIVLLVVYAESMRQSRGNGDVEMPLVNNWTVDIFNKLEEERLSPKNVEETIKSLAAKYKKAGDIMDEADEVLDAALEENPTNEGLLQMKELRDALFRARVFREPANESSKPSEDGKDGDYCSPENDVPKAWSSKDAPDEPFPFTQFYGTPSAYVAYSEQVSAERLNKEKSLRSDKVTVSKFDLNLTQPPATQGRSVDVLGGDKSFDEAEELLESLQVYDSQGLPHFDCFTPEKLVVGRQDLGVSGNVSNGAITPYTICDEAPLQTIIPTNTYVRPKRFGRPAEVLCSPWVRRACSLAAGLSGHEKRATDCLFSGRLSETDILFQTDYAYAPRIVFESLCPGIRISSEAVDMFTKVLNDSERFRDPKKLMCKVFCDTSLMRQWDVKDLKGKQFDVKESSDKFIKGMRGILESTVYRTLVNVDLVFFPIFQGDHFYVVCVHLKRKEVHILDNMLSEVEDAKERYGGLVDFLIARFDEFLSCENHPAQGFLRYAYRMILRLGCMTKNNDIDCGVFAMRHMETYLFGGEYDDLCGLRREGKDQQHQLDELRKKYAAKILLTDLNKKKADFENEELTYKMLPLAQRQLLEAASYERCFARVTKML